MNKQFEKNRLDLAYKRQLQYLNGSIILGTIGILSFLGTFIWNKEKILMGIILLIVILLISAIWHKTTNENLKEISNQIKKLS